MTSRPLRALLAVAVAGGLLAGCGDERLSVGEPGPLTSRAVAAVMLDHLPDDTSSRSATYVDESSPPGLVGADLRYAAGEGDDGDLVRVTVSRAKGHSDCSADPDEHCAELGYGAVLHWDELVEEEDPGIVVVQARHEGQLVTAVAAGPEITGDPRELDIEPSVETLLDLVQDPRLQLEADAETIAAGKALDDWDGGEVDPASLEPVPNDDATVVAGWIWGYGDTWRYVGPSPLKDVFGRGAIGGRVEVTGELGPLTEGFVDALAAPQPPPWLADGCLDGYRCETRNGLMLVWRPAAGDDPGDAFVMRVRKDGETVGFHTVGNRLGERWPGAFPQAGGSFWGPDLDDDAANPLAISLTTTRARYDQAERAARLHD